MKKHVASALAMMISLKNRNKQKETHDMKRVYQRTGSRAGQNGDCFAACIASMLELSLDAVPNFHGEFVNGMRLSPGACQEMTSWFTERGLYYVEFGFHMPVEPTL